MVLLGPQLGAAKCAWPLSHVPSRWGLPSLYFCGHVRRSLSACYLGVWVAGLWLYAAASAAGLPLGLASPGSVCCLFLMIGLGSPPCDRVGVCWHTAGLCE